MNFPQFFSWNQSCHLKINHLHQNWPFSIHYATNLNITWGTLTTPVLNPNWNIPKMAVKMVNAKNPGIVEATIVKMCENCLQSFIFQWFLFRQDFLQGRKLMLNYRVRHWNLHKILDCTWEYKYECVNTVFSALN